MAIGSLFDGRLLEDSYYPRIYAYYFRQWQAYDMAFHRHESTEIMYVIQGECQVEVQTEQAACALVKLKKGEFVLLDASVPHRLIVESACRMLNVEFGFVPRDDAYPSVGKIAEDEEGLSGLIQSPASFFVLQDPDDVYHSLKSLVLELDRRGKEGGALDLLLFYQLLIRIGRLRRNAEGEGARQKELYAKRSLEYLLQNYDRSVRVKDVAAHVSLHPGYLHRIFKEQTGRTITDCLTEIRIDKAKMLLQHTDIPVADVSDYAGIGNRQYFHAVFKKRTGLTPIEFRNSKEAWRRDYEKSEDN